MKRHFVKFLGIICIMLFVVALMQTTAFALTEGDYEYTVSDGKATITAYGGAGGNVVIPSTLGGYPVIAIGDDAFLNKTNVTGMTVPEGVKSIGVRAFFGCSNLETVTLPSTLESVGGQAFQLCNKINRVNISDIAAWCGISFKNDASNPLARGATYDKLYVGGQLIHELVIPEGVTSIEEYAFYSCNGLTGVTLPSTLEKIEDVAFCDCKSLLEIAIPEGVTSIGDSAFYHCTSLESVTLSSVLESIEEYAFYGCTALADIYFLGTSAEWNAVTKGNSWNSGCPAGDNVHIAYTYTVSENKATITAYDGLGGNVVIPSTLGGYPVVAIGVDAFKDKTNVTGVTVPEGVKSIGMGAFFGCSNIETVTLPSTLESVDIDAFQLCNKTNRVNISDIAAWCGISFGNDASNPLGRGATFDKLYVGGQLIHELVIPDGVTSVGKNAFYRCNGLTGVTLPSTLESIGDSAFRECKSLLEIAIPEGVTSIGDSAFYNCTALASVTLPSTLESIVNCAFYNCTALESVTLPSTLESIANYAFYECTALTEIAIPEGVASIGSSAFYHCTSLESVTLPSTLESIGDSAFYGCLSLSKIYFLGTSAEWSVVTKEFHWNSGCPAGDNVHIAYTYTVSEDKATITAYDGPGGDVVIPSTLGGYPVVAIGEEAFRDKTNVTGVTVPEGVTSIGKNAFYNCSSLETVTLPSTLESIGNQAFHLCNKINRVNISDIAAWCGISFGNDASNPFTRGTTYSTTFDKLYVGGQLIHELVIPEGVKSIGKCAFYRCEGLTGVTLPSTLESIGKYAFERCISLSEITIPEGVTSIGYSAFCECTALESVTLPSTLEKIENDAFYKCESLLEIAIPEGVTSIGSSAFYGCTSLSEIVIPEGVTSIGDHAFANCSSLADIYFLGTSTEWNAVTKGSDWDHGCPYCFKITFSKCTVAASVVPDAYGTVTGGGDYEKNTEVTVTATPETGYRFVNWTVGGNVVSTDAEYKFTPSDDIELVANFDFLKYTVTFENHDGTKLQSGGVEFGTKPTYGGKTPTRPSYNDKEYVFVGWSPKIENATGEATYTAMFGIATTDKCSECGKTLYVDPDEITETHHSLYCYNTDCTEYKVAHEVAHGGGTATCKHNAICSVCGVGYGEIDPDNHSAGDSVKENVSVTTCLTEGSYDIVTYCTECGAELSRIEVREEPLGHKFGEWAVTKPASCTESGVETRVCANDPHHTEKREIAATGHEFGEWVVTVAPTESNEGVETRVCSKCGEEETRPIPKLDHAHKMIHYEAVAPTETEEGYKEYYLCSVCGKWYEDAEGKKEIKDHGSIVISALGKPDPIIYGFTVAPKTEWKIGSGEDFVLVSSADFSKFVGAKIDGVLLDKSHFTAVEGSTKVTFKAEYLETLAAGEHTLTIVSADGEASAKVNFVADPGAAKTSPVVWIIIALAVAAACAVVVIAIMKKKK